MVAVECREVTKQFRKVTALNQLSCKLETGKIYALLGRNGAGKTTLMNCICTRYIQTSGEILVLEEPVYENEKVLDEICFMSDEIPAFELKKTDSILKYAAGFYKKWNYELEKQLLNLFELESDKRYSMLSKGKKTALSIVIGLCSGCQVVLFDEIYSGLDAVARQQFYDILLMEQEKNPRTFILSTHLIEEMSGIFTDVVIMDKGKVILQAGMEEIHERSIKCVGRTDGKDKLAGKNILHVKNMGTLSEFDIYDHISPEEQKVLSEQGFSFSAMDLQELFIAMTIDNNHNGGGADGAVNG